MVRSIPAPPAAFLGSLLLAAGCVPQGDPAVPGSGFRDDFGRADLGELWSNTGGPWRIENGELRCRGARNHPLWLRRTLPRDVRIAFDARSDTPDGDLKVEVFGDGVSKAEDVSYTATSYVVIFGGWNNSLNVLARMNEHGDDRIVDSSRKVVPGQTYHVVIERRGRRIEASVDGRPLLRMDDPSPLEGRGHDHFAFNNWNSDVHFDNLVITPL
ncbi:MAG: hypothetical protein U0230_19645 [Polyangiales bacterium]